MSEILFQNVSKSYNPGLFKKKVQAVTNLNLEVQAGEVFGLVGPNGAGKSSTIRLLLGLSRPDEGIIKLRRQVPGSGVILREVGYLPENPYLYDNLSLRELLDFCGRSSGMPQEVMRERAAILMHKLNMTSFQNRPMRTYSKGMLQRAGICFALLHDPSVIILDEPMSGLDPIGRKMVIDLIQELKTQRKTIFFCSHILNDVERLCDRIGVLVGGRLVREFSPEDFRDESNQILKFVLGSLSDHQIAKISAMNGTIHKQKGGIVLSVKTKDFSETVRSLCEMGVEIQRTHHDRVSLEDLFLQAVGEAKG